MFSLYKLFDLDDEWWARYWSRATLMKMLVGAGY
jgi:hypothetical protein